MRVRIPPRLTGRVEMRVRVGLSRGQRRRDINVEEYALLGGFDELQ